ncbi:rhamnogalacturonyl hydrolase YesR [Paenibacillus cellulosilyticus]|uniref:Rhamnogalacturonyl hydrolase YesR n=1 Tax=Paenibacillus cellulosilyticus TaxID=375489 RepID=A0A2V2YE42_9BACL|nr:glycoside hydrolase family 88 protein [Paenibacillus cellulosilyticus]PWV90551.1 rhamnogalacturonyl hydrolase YesR [Paenibacillus cellulosilyticus]QKS47072.1 glycoside hydrolase family 88 protein [Paenibacillus cellulosilyticus]
MRYFEDHESIAVRAAGDDKLILSAVAGRFAGAHPKLPPVYRAYDEGGFPRGEDYRYDMNMAAIWPEMADGQHVYIWGKVWSDNDSELPFFLSCYSPLRVFVNGTSRFASNLNDDVFPERKVYFRTALRQGWNDIVLECVKTGTGCGAIFGTGSVKGFPMHALNPLPERAGAEGWVYSTPQSNAWQAVPGADEWAGVEAQLALTQSQDKLHGQEQGQSQSQPQGQEQGQSQSQPQGQELQQSQEQEQPFRWHPQREWSEEQLEAGCFARLYNDSEPAAGQEALAWAALHNDSSANASLTLSGLHQGPFTLFVDGVPTFRTQLDEGDWCVELSLGFGRHELVIQSVCKGERWGFTAKLQSGGVDGRAMARMERPYPVAGMPNDEVWLYRGLYEAGCSPEAATISRIDSCSEGEHRDAPFWRMDRPDTFVRPYLENGIFGRWNYPLGVTLYGIMGAGEAVGKPHFTEYAIDHIEQCAAMHEYAMKDTQRWGSPGVNHQLSLIDSLDDCGSFGATMLEANKRRPVRGAEEAAAHIAHYITHVQDRTPEGALYRTRGTTDFMQQTMWCDDLYMSTPFLTKYYELTSDISYLDDAARQFLLYKRRMFIPERGIMHHVYDFKFDKPNGVPWGRGNGWVLFSLTELLAVMPHEHRLRPELLTFFRELCEGYLRLQDEQGLWHQVLTDPTSYAEASCTSMFIYSFARGVRFGWLDEPEKYTAASLRGWNGLTRHCIDRHGNVYGVCRGSGYSFAAHYYRDQLSWQLNDTHGVGIVLLAGVETMKLRQFLESVSASGRTGAVAPTAH